MSGPDELKARQGFRLNHIGLASQKIEELGRIFRVLGMDMITEPVPDPLFS